MAKSTSKYVCQECSYESGKWHGRCPQCGNWGSLVETVVSPSSKFQSQKSKGSQVSKEPINLYSVSSKKTSRTSTKISELDRVLGGGLVAGQVVLIAGEPGIGKSTILLQLSDMLGEVLYVSGEESVSQIKLRADRLKVKKKTIQIMEETDVDTIIYSTQQLSTKPKVLIVDSIQTMSTTDLSGMAGSVGQVRESAYRLIRFAKSTNTSVFIVGHVTKEGNVAGPAVLSHLVDTVLWFEGDKSHTIRMLRAMKNRFGPTDEVGIFSMEDKGLKSLANAEKIFLSKARKQIAGSVVTSVMKGSRPLLIEVQSLVVPTKLAFPRRIAQGFDSKRLELLLAVLARRCSLPMYEFDVFVNITGGINLRGDPSADLAVCLSIASAYLDKPLAKSTLAIGEVGLLGDIREVIGEDKRMKEARRIGFRNIISQKKTKYLQEAIKKFIK